VRISPPFFRLEVLFLKYEHSIDFTEVVDIAATAVHILLTSHPNREFSVTYLATAIKWAIQNELRYRYEWYCEIIDTDAYPSL